MQRIIIPMPCSSQIQQVGVGGYSPCLVNFSLKKVYKWQTKITTFLNNQPQLSNQFPINSLPSTEKHQVQHFVMIVCCGTIDKIKVQLTHATGVSGKYCLSFCHCITAQLIKHLVQLSTPTRGWLTFPLNFKIICVITFSLLKYTVLYDIFYNNAVIAIICLKSIYNRCIYMSA